MRILIFVRCLCSYLHRYVCMCISICMYLCRSHHVYLCLIFALIFGFSLFFVVMFAFLIFHLSGYLCIYLSIYLSVYLSIYLSTYLQSCSFKSPILAIAVEATCFGKCSAGIVEDLNLADPVPVQWPEIYTSSMHMYDSRAPSKVSHGDFPPSGIQAQRWACRCRIMGPRKGLSLGTALLQEFKSNVRHADVG